MIDFIKGFVYAVTAASILFALLALVMPEGKTKKIISFVFSAAAALIVISAVSKGTSDGVSNNLFSEFSYENVFNEYSCDNENLRIFIANEYISNAKKSLLDEGIVLENAGVSFGEKNDGVLPEKFIVNVSDLVIIKNEEHINISSICETCKNILEQLFGGEVEVVINEC